MSPWLWPESLDALVAAPKQHTLLLENERVRVLDTRILPGDTTPVHTHRWPSVLYVLSWSDVVRRDGDGKVMLDLAALDGCAHLLRADVWFSPTMLEGGNLRLFAEARRRGLATSLDINFDPRWSTGLAAEIARRKQLLRSVLDLTDLAHGNVRELCEFTDSPDLETALKRLSNWGVKAVVVHLGAQGAGYYAGGPLIVEPPSRAECPVHSTGTGDVLSLCMILLHARQDMAVREKLRLANRVVREFMEGRRTLVPTI
jgi:sugar/nucleoside kinase (ribokinase family)